MESRPRPSSAVPGSWPRPSQSLRTRSRSRSREEERQRLARHEGANRSLQPAWMSRGIGVNEEILGETRGDLIKPGLTQADLDDLESKVQRRSNSPDPLGDFFESRPDSKAQQRSDPDPLADFFDSRPEKRQKSPDPLADFFDSRKDDWRSDQRTKGLDAQASWPRHEYEAPVPNAYGSWNDPREPSHQRARDGNGYDWQRGGHYAPEPGWQRAQESWHDSREGGQKGWQGEQSDGSDYCQVLIDLTRRALGEGGLIQGHRLGEILHKHHRDLCNRAKEKFGKQGWMATMVSELTTDLKVANLQEHGGPCFYMDADGSGHIPSHQAPVIIAGDKLPVKGNAQIYREQRIRKEKKMLDESEGLSPDPNRRRVRTPDPDRRRVCTPSPERITQPADGPSASSAKVPEREAEPMDSSKDDFEDDGLPSKSVWDLL